jgi:hypothetical protein
MSDTQLHDLVKSQVNEHIDRIQELSSNLASVESKYHSTQDKMQKVRRMNSLRCDTSLG